MWLYLIDMTLLLQLCTFIITNWLTDYSFYIYTALTESYNILYLVTLEHIHEDWKDLESDAMLTGSEEIPNEIPL